MPIKICKMTSTISNTRLTLKHIIISPPPKPKILYQSLFVLYVITNCVDRLEFSALNPIKNTKLYSRIIINFDWS